MKRIYHHYIKWETYKSGMHKLNVPNEKEKMFKSVKLLKNLEELETFMQLVSENWNISNEQNMTNPSRNRQAYLGQAACCYAHGAPEYVTKQAWSLLTDQERCDANRIADKIIDKYLKSKNYAKEISRPKCI